MIHPLSPLEHCIFNFDQAAIFNFFVLARIQGRLLPEILRIALHTVQKKHYYLNVSIVNSKPNQPQFIYHENASIPLRFIEQPNEAFDLQQTEDELNLPFDHHQAPLVRAVVITANPEKCSLIVTFSHIIADGMADVLFVRDVLAICGQLLQGQSIHEPLPLPALSPTDDLFPENRPEEVPSQDVPPPLPGSSPYVSFSERRTHLIHRHFSENDTQPLISKCRQEQTTVQGALCAALLLALQQKIYTDLQAQPPVIITCNSPINLRHERGYRISIPAEQMGFWIGWGKTDYQLETDTTFWNLAREVHANLTEIIDSHTCFNFKVLTQGLGKSPVEFTKSYEYRTPYLMISNLGDLDPKIPHAFGPLTLTDLHFGVGRHYCHSSKWSFSLTANTFNGKLIANFLYVEPFLNRQEADHIVQSCLKQLTVLI